MIANLLYLSQANSNKIRAEGKSTWSIVITHH